MSDITPGPWITREATGAIAIAQDGYLPHATVFERSGDLPVNDETRANAKAIAALPELLEALEALLENAELDALNEENAELDETIRAAREALDKAGRFPLGVTVRP